MKKNSRAVNSQDRTADPSVIQLSKIYRKTVTLQPSHPASWRFNSYYTPGFFCKKHIAQFFLKLFFFKFFFFKFLIFLGISLHSKLFRLPPFPILYPAISGGPSLACCVANFIWNIQHIYFT